MRRVLNNKAFNCPPMRTADTFGYNVRSEVVFSRRDAEGAEHAYSYDNIGNLLLSTFNSETNTYTANNLNQYTSILRASVPPREPTYDRDGNMLSDGVLSFTYDAANRLNTVSSNNVLLVTNFYDAKSRRVKKVTPEATTTFFHDDWNLIEERVAYTNGTSTTIRYFWGKDLSGTLQGAGGVGGLLYLTVSNSQLQLYVPCYDNIGNITRYLDASGNTVAQYTYDVFGKIITQAGSLADFFRHRFSTKYYDAVIDLYDYGYRFYSPPLRRWLNRDPVEETGGVNLYVFCVNSPTSRYDVDGQSWLICFGDCIEEWRLDWGKIFTAMNAAASVNAPVPKTGTERLWLEKGVSENTTELSRAISQGERLARKLPLGNPVRSKIIQSLGNVRRFMRNPALVKAGAAGAALAVFEGFYDIGTMLYCSIHCCGG